MYRIHTRGENWFHFRAIRRTAMESFSITYCHDGTVCMTGDMGCLSWQRMFFPKTPDYGFPFADTGIDYFAEKVARAEEMQKTKSWDAERAIRDIAEAICEERDAEDTSLLRDVLDCLSCFESEEYGYFQMIDVFQERANSIEVEEYCEYGMWYAPHFIQRFGLIRSVSDLILEAVEVR